MLSKIKEKLLKGNLSVIDGKVVLAINDMATAFLSNKQVNLNDIYDLLVISNILYNNTSRNILPLEDGVYDLVVAKYNNLTGGKAPVGAIPVHFDEEELNTIPIDDSMDKKIVIERISKRDNMLFYDNIIKNQNPIKADFDYNIDNTLIENATKNISHSYPELVGTLDKCKFTLLKEAREHGVDPYDPSIVIFERDFFGRHIQQGILNPNVNTEMIVELKYDGVSIEMEVDGDTVISATSRGDTSNDEATDFTPIFEGYKFSRASNIQKGTRFGIKFEAIITYDNLQRIQELFGKSYKNGRVAIIGILGSLDARKFRDFITLVPLATAGLGIIDRKVEVEFLNKYYSSGVNLKYSIIQGDYYKLLFQIDKFTKEAEYMRQFMPFMYDGIVVSYTDPNIKNILGRSNSINKWSIAIKFNAMKKQTIFLGYQFTVGQNGMITPMGYFTPVEFLGTTHNKTTVHSLKRFNQLELRKGDIVEIEYRNDVICYLSKPFNAHNSNNKNPIIEFPNVCPSCGTELTISDTGNSAYCLNPVCEEKKIGRMTNMLKKLNIKDFGKSSIKALNIFSFKDLINLSESDAINIFGEVIGSKLIERIHELKEKQFTDYRIIGSLGFNSVAIDTWKKIFAQISVESIVSKSDEELYSLLQAIKGVGKITAQSIVDDRKYLIDDIIFISKMPNIIRTFGSNIVLRQVRFTGVRDVNLENAFNKAGYDANGDKSVTSKTAILIVPYYGFTSSKTKKASIRCVQMTVDDAWNYLNSPNIV